MPPHAMDTTLIISNSISHHQCFAPITKRKKAAPASNKKTSSKSVSFYKSVKVHRVLHVLDYTKDEVKATWYTESDMSAMKKYTKDSVKQLESLGVRKCHEEDPYFCSRGLEHRTREGGKRRSQNRSSAIQSVVEEQKRQKSQGISDPNHLAFVYVSESRHCQVMAQETGMDDEYAIRKSRRR